MMIEAEEKELGLVCAAASTNDVRVTNRITAIYHFKQAQLDTFARSATGDPAKALRFRWVIGAKNETIRDFFVNEPETAMKRAGLVLPWPSVPAHFAVAYQMWSNGRRHALGCQTRCFSCPHSRTRLNCVASTCYRENESEFPGVRYLHRLYSWVKVLAMEGRDQEIPSAVDIVYRALMTECEDPDVAAALRQTAADLDLCRGCFQTIGGGERSAAFPSVHLSCLMKYVKTNGETLIGMSNCHSRHIPVDPRNPHVCNLW